MDDRYKTQERELDELFRSYREACEPTALRSDFLPRIWTKIEARQKLTFSLRRFTRVFVVASAAACALLVVLIAIPPPGGGSEIHSTYVEALADEQSPDRLLLQDVALRASSPEPHSRSGGERSPGYAEEGPF
jgi:hypothetical protein